MLGRLLALLGLVNATPEEPAEDAQNTTLPMNGMRQPHVGRRVVTERVLTIHAVSEPRKNPSVVPAAVELAMMPRISGDASSVV